MSDEHEPDGHNALPFLSHSRVNRYLHCPEQYRLYYVERLRPKLLAANLAFGQVMHEALAALFRTEADPVAFFEGAWDEARQTDLAYSRRDSWEKLHDIGRGLLERFIRDERRKVTDLQAVEAPFSLTITNLPLPFVGIIDLVARIEGRTTVVDFKTASSGYAAHEATLSDQLTAYTLAEPQVTQAALCVLVKTTDPAILWQRTERDGSRLTEYLTKVRLVADAITAGNFYKRPGRWCTWCDYLPVCTGDRASAEETLIHLG